MFKNKKIAVIIPAYNEERRIQVVLDTMPAFVDLIIAVDDSSTDKTNAILNAQKEKFKKRLIIVCHVKNQGVGAAIITGYKEALDNKMDIIAVMAGDAQMNPGELERIISPVVEGRADYAKGDRITSSFAFRKIPKVRFMAGILLSCLTKLVSGYWHVIDPQSGFTAISAKALNKIELDRIYKRYGFPNALLTELNIVDQRVQNVPITPIYHSDGTSGIRYEKIIFTLSLLLFKLFLHRIWQKYTLRNSHPLVLFYLFGSLISFTGIVMGLIIFFVKGYISFTIVIFTAILIIAGLQLLLFAMWFDMEENKHLCIYEAD